MMYRILFLAGLICMVATSPAEARFRCPWWCWIFGPIVEEAVRWVLKNSPAGAPPVPTLRIPGATGSSGVVTPPHGFRGERVQRYDGPVTCRELPNGRRLCCYFGSTPVVECRRVSGPHGRSVIAWRAYCRRS
jgi:hypothetical protein